MAAIDIDPAEARLATTRIKAMLSDVRGCALTDRQSGELLASEPPHDGWELPTRALWTASERGAGGPVTRFHIGIADGEAFGVREGELAMVAVTDRLTLGSLVVSDLRAMMRELQAKGTVRACGARSSEAEFVPGVSGVATAPDADPATARSDQPEAE